jgi:hypothetical protein
MYTGAERRNIGCAWFASLIKHAGTMPHKCVTNYLTNMTRMFAGTHALVTGAEADRQIRGSGPEEA